jgi:hypothetical protein
MNASTTPARGEDKKEGICIHGFYAKMRSLKKEET